MFIQYRGGSQYFLQGQDGAGKKALHWRYLCKIVAVQTCNRTSAGPCQPGRQTGATPVRSKEVAWTGDCLFHDCLFHSTCPSSARAPSGPPLPVLPVDRRTALSPLPSCSRPRRIESARVIAVPGLEAPQVTTNSMASAAPTMQGRCFERVANTSSIRRPVLSPARECARLQRFFPLCSRHLACPRST